MSPEEADFLFDWDKNTDAVNLLRDTALSDFAGGDYGSALLNYAAAVGVNFFGILYSAPVQTTLAVAPFAKGGKGCPTGRGPGRHGALNLAKRDAGLLRSQHPDSVARVPMTDRSGNRVLDSSKQPIMTREYTYTRPDGSKVVIQDHSSGHTFGQQGVGDQGPHFNVRPTENTRTGSVPGTLDHYPFWK